MQTAQRGLSVRRFIFDMVLGFALLDALGAGCALQHPVDVPPDYPPLERELGDAGGDGR